MKSLKSVLLDEGLSRAQATRILGKTKFGETYGGPNYNPGGRIPGGFGGDGPSAPTDGSGNCGTSIDGAGEPYVIVSTTPIAAAALTAGTALTELFDASQSSQLADDGKVQDKFISESIKMYLSVQAVVDGGVEGIGNLFGQMFVREATGAGGGQEIALWPLSALGATVGYFGGFGTSTGGVAFDSPMVAAGIPWNRTYEATGTYSLALQIALTKTTINVVDVTFVLTGRRYAG